MPPVQLKLFTLPQPPASCADILRRLEALPDKVGKFPDDESYLPAHVKKFAGEEILPLSLIATLLKSNAYINHRLTRAIRSCARIDDASRKGGNNQTWYKSAERKKFYRENPADQEGEALTELLMAESASELTKKRRELLQLMVELFEERDLVSFKEIKDHIKHTASKPHERSKEEQWAELLIELCAFYSWMRNRGRRAHVWLLLASPTIEQVDTFEHTQTTYVFRKGHKHDVAAVLGKIARSLNIDEPSFKRLMHVLAKTAKEVKKEEEEKLVKLIEHTWVALAKDDRATQRPTELRPALASAAGRANGVVKELRRRSGFHIAFSSAEVEAAVKFLVELAASNSKTKPGKEIKLSREALKDAINDKSKFERTSVQIKNLINDQRLPLMLAVQKAGYDLSLIWRDELIKNAGFVEDEEAPTGWVHPSAVDDEDEEMVDECDDDDAKEEEKMMVNGKEEEEENPFKGLLTLDGMLENDDFDELDEELNPDDDDDEEEKE